MATNLKDNSPKPSSSLTKNDSYSSQIKESASSPGPSASIATSKPVDASIDKEAEQKRLEDEMRKRRDRIEKWRNEKKLKETKEQAELTQSQVAGKAWNLEDEDEDEEDEETRAKKGADVTISGATAKQQLQLKRESILQQKQEQQQLQEQLLRERELLVKQQALENEEDPLDAYMKEISKAAKGLIKTDSKKVNVVNAVKTPAVVKTEPLVTIKEEPNVVVTKMKIVEGGTKVTKDKGDIMEQDIDGLEYLSDEESAAAEGEDASTLKPKNKSDMISTDHNKIFYRPFRKNFYVEVPEIKEMTLEGKRISNINIHFKGKSFRFSRG